MSLLVIPLGLIIGLSLGALGGGGSILTVPALVFALGQDPRTATTSSLVIVGLTALIAVVPHARGGRVRLVQGLVFGALGTVGSIVGSALVVRVEPQILLVAFALLMLVVATLMVLRSRRPTKTNEAPATGTAATPLFTLHPVTVAWAPVAKILATATAVGLLTGFFGVGGGFILVPALVLVLRFPMPLAVGTSLVVIAVNSATALATRIGTGSSQLDWALIGVFTAAAVAGSLVGGRITSRVEPHHLTRAFAILLAVVAVYTAVRSIPELF